MKFNPLIHSVFFDDIHFQFSRSVIDKYFNKIIIKNLRFNLLLDLWIEIHNDSNHKAI